MVQDSLCARVGAKTSRKAATELRVGAYVLGVTGRHSNPSARGACDCTLRGDRSRRLEVLVRAGLPLEVELMSG
jgi:hypothetical protein